MTTQYPLFSKVVLAKDLPAYNLRRGATATIVEHYSMPEGEEDGYSLEGFDVPQVTVEVLASQVISESQWRQEELILTKVRQLSEQKRLQLEQYLDSLVQKDEERVSA